jgi:hypothetical protein
VTFPVSYICTRFSGNVSNYIQAELTTKRQLRPSCAECLDVTQRGVSDTAISSATDNDTLRDVSYTEA